MVILYIIIALLVIGLIGGVLLQVSGGKKMHSGMNEMNGMNKMNGMNEMNEMNMGMKMKSIGKMTMMKMKPPPPHVKIEAIDKIAFPDKPWPSADLLNKCPGDTHMWITPHCSAGSNKNLINGGKYKCYNSNTHLIGGCKQF